MPKYNVQYSRVVVMRIEVEADSPEAIDDFSLPGVYDGIPASMIPAHIHDVLVDENDLATIEEVPEWLTAIPMITEE